MNSRLALAFLVYFFFSGVRAQVNSSQDSRSLFPKQNCEVRLLNKVKQLAELKKIMPNAHKLRDSHCICLVDKKTKDKKAVVLYLFQRADKKMAIVLAFYEVKKRDFFPLYFSEILGDKIFPFYIKESRRIKRHVLFAFDFDFDGKQEVFVNSTVGMRGKDLQVYEINKKYFKLLRLTQINNKISQANSKFISSLLSKEIVLRFLPKTNIRNPVFEVYFQDPKKLSVKKLLNPMRYIKSRADS